MSTVTRRPGVLLLEWHHGLELSQLAGSGREQPGRFRAFESGKRTFVVTRRAAAFDPKQPYEP